MALDALLGSLARDADADASRILDQARAEASRIGAESAARIAARSGDALAARERELVAEGESRRARLTHEGAVTVLRARDQFLERVMTAAASQFPCALDAPDRADALAHLIDEALSFVPGVPVVIRCRPGLVPRATSHTESLGCVRVEAAPAVPEGVIVEAEDGSVQIDNTLTDRLRRLRPALSVEILAQFGAADESNLG